MDEARGRERSALPLTLDLTPKQALSLATIFNSHEVFLLGGVRSGKSTVIAEAAVQSAFEWEPGIPGILSAPTWGQLERNLLVPWRELAPKGRYEIVADPKDPRIECYIGKGKISKIYLASGKNPGHIEGATAGWAGGTELQQMGSFWGVVRKRVSDKRARRLRLFGDGLTEEGWLSGEVKRRGLRVIFFSTLENAHNLGAGYLAQLRGKLTLRQWAIYVEGKFAGAEDAVYGPFSREIHASRRVEFQKGKRVLLAQDWNLNPMSGVCAQWYGDTLWIFDEVIAPRTTIEQGEAIKRWARNMGIDHTKRDQLVILPDSTGGRRNQGDGKSNLYLFQQAGLHVETRWINPLRVDGDQAVLVLLENAQGEAHLFLDPQRCKVTIESLASLKHAGREDSEFSHATDCVRYLSHYCSPVKAPSARPVSAGARPPLSTSPRSSREGKLSRFGL